MNEFNCKSCVSGQKQISRALEKFHEMGLSEVVNGEWYGGKRAKTYKAAYRSPPMARARFEN